MKLDSLVTVLRKVPSETSYFLDYIQDHKMTFSQACAFLREKSMLKDTFHESNPEKSPEVSPSRGEPGETEYEKVYNIIQNWANETKQDIHHVFAAMNSSPMLRDSLMVPTKLWMKLAPDIKKAIMEARKDVNDQEKAQKTNQSASSNVPKQYSNPSQANYVSHQSDKNEVTDEHRVMMTSRTNVQRYDYLIDDSSDDDSMDYGYESNSFIARSDKTRGLFGKKSTSHPVAYVDGGADSCIGGIGWKVVAYTGRKTSLVGFDERYAKKKDLDVCTLATKVQTSPNKPPVILIAHEAIYNPGSTTSLISEFQVREHGCVVDSVSIEHRISRNGTKGTQTFYAHDDVPIPLKEVKGLMCFPICEPTDKEMNELEHIVITSPRNSELNDYVHNVDVIEFEVNNVEEKVISFSDSGESMKSYECNQKLTKIQSFRGANVMKDDIICTRRTGMVTRIPDENVE